MSYLFPLVLALICCFGLQVLALKAVGGRTTKSESNFFSSVGRIQAGAQGKPDLMVLGSSITGRLPDKAQGILGTANMGCDGGSAVDALRAMDNGILPIAPHLVIEANTLHLALEEEPTEIGLAMLRPWFRVGLQVPSLAAYARPSSFCYSKLLAYRTGGYDTVTTVGDLGVESSPTMISQVKTASLTARQEELIGEVSAILKRLKARGASATIVWLPPARDTAGAPSWILELARQSGTPYWDLGQEADPQLIKLTDSIHMDGKSATLTMRSLVKLFAPE